MKYRVIVEVNNIFMANPKSLEARQAYIDEKPFEGFKISDNSILDHLEGRRPCPKCCKSRKFFCYTCYVPVKDLEDKLPMIKLPIKIDIIKHKHEIDGKSTSGHAAILAPDDVRVYTYPDIPNYEDESAVLIYPSCNALTVNEVCKGKSRCQPEEILPKGFNHCTLLKKLTNNVNDDIVMCSNLNKVPISRAVFIDSTWNQSNGIYKDERIKRLQCVILQNRISQFWRHQKGSPRWYLSTVEAIHQFLIELHINVWGLNPLYGGLKNCFNENFLKQFEDCDSSFSDSSYCGQYDDLLFFFEHMYNLIHSYYKHEDLHAYKRRLM